MTARRYDLAPEPFFVSHRWEEFGDGPWGGVVIRVRFGLVPAAGHLGVQEVGCDDHLIGVDGGYCLYCRAQV